MVPDLDTIIVAQADVEAAEKTLKAAKDKLHSIRTAVYRESKLEMRIGVWEINAWYSDADNLWILTAHHPATHTVDQIRLPWTVAMEMIRGLAEKYCGD